ncbi:MAG: tetratricopeptide repeat protein [FCB group bacterium]|nr:tetratricopeptide repeat protein [FCB group bacterium]
MHKVLLITALFFAIACLSGCAEDTPEERIEAMRELVADEKYEKALKELWQVIDQRPTDSTVLYLGGRVFFGLTWFDSAVSYSKKLCALYPQNVAAYRLLYESAGFIEDYKTQLWAISQLGYIEGNRSRYYYNIAELNFQLQDYGLAISTCDAILKTDPDNKSALFLKANSLASAGKIDSGITILEILDRKYPGRVEILSNMASFYATKRDYPNSEFHFQQITEMFPDYVPGWYGLGNVRLKLADTLGARNAYGEVYARDSAFLGVDSILDAIAPKRF